MKLFWLCSHIDQKWKKNNLRLLNGNFLYVFDYLVLQLSRLSCFLCQFVMNLQKEFMRFHPFSLGTLHFDMYIVSWRNPLFPNIMPLVTSSAHTIFRWSCKSTLYYSLFHSKLKMQLILILFSSPILLCPFASFFVLSWHTLSCIRWF